MFAVAGQLFPPRPAQFLLLTVIKLAHQTKAPTWPRRRPRRRHAATTPPPSAGELTDFPPKKKTEPRCDGTQGSCAPGL